MICPDSPPCWNNTCQSAPAMFIFSRIIMPSDCTKSWQVGQRVLSVYPSDPVSPSSKAPCSRGGKTSLSCPTPPPKLYAQECLGDPFEGATPVPVLSSGTLHTCTLPMETSLPSITSTGSHYVFLIDFFKIAGLYRYTCIGMLPSCKTSFVWAEDNSEPRPVSIQGFPNLCLTQT